VVVDPALPPVPPVPPLQPLCAVTNDAMPIQSPIAKIPEARFMNASLKNANLAR
jgi:hypothetical protein